MKKDEKPKDALKRIFGEIFGEESMPNKVDMSTTCGLGQIAMEKKRMSGEISEEQFVAWYESHCRKCVYEHVVCMYGEFDPNNKMNLL